MVEWLPLDAPVYRAEKGHAWVDETVLLHDVSSQLRALNTGLANMFRDKGQPAHEIELLPAPGVDDDFTDGAVVDDDERTEIAENLQRLWGD